MAWLGSWENRRKIIVDADQIGADLTDFPFAVFITTTCSQTGVLDLSEIFDDLGSNSKKVAFTKADGVTQLYAEIEKWDTGNERGVYHVKAAGTDEISSSVDTEFYIYWDNAQPDNTTYIGDLGDTVAANVWDSFFDGVYHCADASPGSGLTDSTGNNNDLTAAGTIERVNAGFMDSWGCDYDQAPSGDIHYRNNTTDFDYNIDDEFTIEWMDTEGELYYPVTKIVPSGDFQGYRILNIPGSSLFMLEIREDGSNRIRRDATAAIGGGENFAAVSYDGGGAASGISLFRGNSSITVVDISGTTTDNGTPTDTTSASNMSFNTNNASQSTYPNDYINIEVRLSNIERSAAWIIATGENLMDDLLTYGSTENFSSSSSSAAPSSSSESSSSSDASPSSSSTSSSSDASPSSSSQSSLSSISSSSVSSVSSLSSALSPSSSSQSSLSSLSSSSVSSSSVSSPSSSSISSSSSSSALSPSSSSESSLSSVSSSSSASEGTLAGWDYRLKIIIDKDEFDEDVFDFPYGVGINNSSGQLSEDVTVLFDELGSDAQRKKIMVTKKDGITPLNVEIEHWDAASQRSSIWIGVDKISSTADTILWLYFDKNQADNTTYVGDTGDTPAKAIWSAYEAVYHLATDPVEPGFQGQIEESGTNSIDGEAFNFESGKLVNSPLGKAIDFDGTDEHIQIPDNANLSFGDASDDDAFTLEAFVNMDDATAFRMIEKRVNGGGDLEYLLSINASDGCFFNLYDLPPTSNRIGRRSADNSETSFQSAWTHYAGVYRGTGIESGIDVLRNGVAIDTLTNGVGSYTAMHNTAGPLQIGREAGASPSYSDGRIAEIRVSRAELSAAWLASTAENLKDNTHTFSEIPASVSSSSVSSVSSASSLSSSSSPESPSSVSSVSSPSVSSASSLSSSSVSSSSSSSPESPSSVSISSFSSSSSSSLSSASSSSSDASPSSTSSLSSISSSSVSSVSSSSISSSSSSSATSKSSSSSFSSSSISSSSLSSSSASSSSLSSSSDSLSSSSTSSSSQSSSSESSASSFSRSSGSQVGYQVAVINSFGEQSFAVIPQRLGLQAIEINLTTISEPPSDRISAIRLGLSEDPVGAAQAIRGIINEEDTIQEIAPNLITIGDYAAVFPVFDWDIFLDNVSIKHRVESADMNFDQDSVHNTFSLESIDPELFNRSNPNLLFGEPRIEIHLGARIIKFLLESRKGDEVSFGLWGRSLSALDDSPYKAALDYTLSTRKAASDIADEIITENPVDWQLVDWVLPVEFEFTGHPIEGLRRLVSAVGGVVRSDDDGTLICRPYYPARPVDALAATADVDYARVPNIIRLDYEDIRGNGYDYVEVFGYSPSASDPLTELEEDSPTRKQTVHLRVYWAGRRPSSAVSRFVTSGAIANQGEDTESVTEVVVFRASSGFTSKPITSLTGISYIGFSGGSATFTPNSSELILSTPDTWAIGEVKYTTTFSRYQLASHDVPKLLAVLGIPTESDTSVAVVIDPGDSPAPNNINEGLLTNRAAAIARGTTFLDKNKYNKKKIRLRVPYDPNGLDGNIAHVDNVKVNVSGNSQIMSVGIAFRGPQIITTIGIEQWQL